MTLPLVWTGLFGAFLFGFTLTWNDFDRTVLLVLDNTLPLQIVGLIQAAALRPDLYALGHGDDAGLAVGDRAAPDRDRRPLALRADARSRASRRSSASAAGSTPRPQSRSSRR